MKKNIGKTDKIVRLSIAVVIVFLYFTKLISGVAAIVLGVIGIGLVFTSMVRRCSFYLPFGISTCELERKD
jgi:hypothetical protein